MISFTVRMRFSAADHDEIAEILRKLTEASRQEPGCVTYVPHFVEGDANMVVIYEQYADEAALDHHRNSLHFKEYAVGGLYQKMLDRQLENLTAVC
ncbi:putative quinol monooxygenase [Edaphobacter sp. 12200R-103]|jgi:quinol monooxygenase YgiN|uniref:putative quinol monooxygenase n=1 Tax=Edaphobacter sp. 12200R-103 TaxID=2703788 RepID=UPI00138B7033|nr:putative quinol monooxygenase [Edaphobacter sp. 12200R-103]QHS53299.1 antibiotic biosynthesis monooxygenase [Edaphobacter sp. 12200R-103]